MALADTKYMNATQTAAGNFRVRRCETFGPRGGIQVDWQVFDIRRQLDNDGGWCQTYGCKADAVAAVRAMNG